MENKPELPLGWKWVRLGEVCEKIQYGLTATATDNKDGFPFIRITDIDDLGNIKLESMRYTYCYEEIFRKYELKENDILFARTGSIGRTFLYNGIPSKAIFASYLIRFRPKKDIVDPLLLFYYSHSPSYFKFIGEKKHTVSQPNINAEEYKSLPIPLPPLPEQKRIAAKLQEMMQEIDQARAACEKQLEAAKSLSSSYLHEVFESPKAQKWEKKRLGEICKIYQPKTITLNELKKNGRYKVYGANGVIGYYDKYNHENSEVLITCRGATCGTVNISEPFSWITGNAMVVSPLSNDLDKEYLFYFLKKSDLLSTISGSAQPQITRASLSPVEVYIPAIEIQKRIAAYLREKIDQAEKLRASIEKELETINVLPQSILSKAFKGEI
jgi:restriction endonuclease S subunit